MPVPGARVGYRPPYVSPNPYPYTSPTPYPYTSPSLYPYTSPLWPAGYGGSSYEMQLAQKQAAAEAQAESLFRQATAAAERLEAGDRARRDGDIRLAANI